MPTLLISPHHSGGVAADPLIRELDAQILTLRSATTHVLTTNPRLRAKCSWNTIVTAPAHGIAYHVPPPTSTNPHFFTNEEQSLYHRNEFLGTVRQRRACRRELDRCNGHFNPLCHGGVRWRIPKAPSKRQMVVKRMKKRKMREMEAAKRAKLMEKGGAKEDPVDLEEEEEVVAEGKIGSEEITTEMKILEMKKEVEMLKEAEKKK